MSALLLDTHVWLWFAEGVSERLRPANVRRLAPLDAAISVESTLLPGEPRGDPADRFLIATARCLDVALATRDALILAYAKQGFVRVARI